MGKHNQFRRVKHRQFPGDLPVSVKIGQRETMRSHNGFSRYSVRKWLKGYLFSRTRAILKRRAAREIEEQLS